MADDSANPDDAAGQGDAASGDYNPMDRRPIKSRNTSWAAGISGWLARRGASPNGISVLGVFFAAGAAVAFAMTSQASGPDQQIQLRLLWFAGALLCQLRLLCNLFDGMVAVARGVASAKGELYNEVPDRISDAAIFVGLGYAAGGCPTLGFTAALLAVFVAYVRALAKSVGCPSDFCGPQSKSQRMALVTVVTVYLALSPAAWRWTFTCCDHSLGEIAAALTVVILGCVITATRRLLHAAKYLEGNVE